MFLNTDMQWLNCMHDDRSYTTTEVNFACSGGDLNPVYLPVPDIEPTNFGLCCTWTLFIQPCVCNGFSDSCGNRAVRPCYLYLHNSCHNSHQCVASFTFPSKQLLFICQVSHPFQFPDFFNAILLCPEGTYECLQIHFGLLRHDKRLVLMFLTRLLTTLAHLYNLVGWLKM